MNEKSNSTALILYGIKNCSTIKKARAWLEESERVYHFHDYRLDGLDNALLCHWEAKLGWQSLLNTRGSTWRKLSEEQRNNCNNPNSAIALMQLYPALIKRPLLEDGNGNLLLGFSPESYQLFLSKVMS